MRLLLLLAIGAIIIQSCGAKAGENNGQPFQAGKTPLSTLKEIFSRTLSNPDNYDAKYYFLKKHKEEVLKSLEVVEEVEVKKEVALVFYKYNVGAETAKGTMYFRKMDNLYIPYSVYFSSYQDDPFKNGKPEEGKRVLEKKDEWEKNENVWWAL